MVVNSKKSRTLKINIIFVISMVFPVGIDVYIIIFNMMKFQALRAFYSSSVQLLLTIPSGTQCALCALQSYSIAFESIKVENHQKWSTTPSMFNKKKMKLIETERSVIDGLKAYGLF